MAIIAATSPPTLIQDLMSVIDGQMIGFAMSGAAAASRALTPVIIAILTATFVVWLLLAMTGHIDTPIFAGGRKFLRIFFVTAIALNAANYGHLIVSTAFALPDQIAALYMSGPSSSASLLDNALWQGDILANAYKDQGSGITTTLIWFIMAIFVWVMTVAMVIIGAMLLALSHFFLAIIIALGPFFICTLYWHGPRDFFNMWLKQVVTLMLTYVMAVMTISLTLKLWQPTLDAANGTVANGFTSLLPVLVIGGIGMLAMRQVNMIARGLGGGWHLDLMHSLGSLTGAGWSTVRGGARQLSRLERRQPPPPREPPVRELVPIEPVADYYHHRHHHDHPHQPQLPPPERNEPPPRDDRWDWPNTNSYN